MPQPAGRRDQHGPPAARDRVTRFGHSWLAGEDMQPASAITRPLLERYLAALGAAVPGTRDRISIENLNGFLTAVRQHEWDPGLLPPPR